MYSIYAIRCKENGKIYIGCTSKPVEERIHQHISELRNQRKTAVFSGTNVGPGRPLTQWQLDFNEYGEDAFEYFLIESNVPDSQRRQRESFWMDEFKTCDKRYGYNFRRASTMPYEIQTGLPPKPF